MQKSGWIEKKKNTWMIYGKKLLNKENGGSFFLLSSLPKWKWKVGKVKVMMREMIERKKVVLKLIQWIIGQDVMCGVSDKKLHSKRWLGTGGCLWQKKCDGQYHYPLRSVSLAGGLH